MNNHLWRLGRLLTVYFQFLTLTAFSQVSDSISAKKGFLWGTITTKNFPSGLVLNVELIPYHQHFAGGIAAIGTALPRIASERVAFPSQEFFLAIPPGVTLKSQIGQVQSSLLVPDSISIPIGYHQTHDSSLLAPVTVLLRQCEQQENIPLLEVYGYAWYRGYRLARIRLSPYRWNGSLLQFTDRIEARFEFQKLEVPSSHNNQPSANDLLVNELVANPADLPRIAKSPLPWNDSTGNWIDYTKNYILLKIAEDGLYRLRYENLQREISEIGSIDPKTFHLFNKGKELPLYCSGEEDGKFEPGDYLEFPGFRNYELEEYRKIATASGEYPNFLNRYTDTSYYCLTWGGEEGLRYSTNEGIRGAADTLSWYTEVQHLEKNSFLQFVGDNLLLHQDPRWLAGDVWGWSWLSAKSTFQATFQVNNLFRNYPAARFFVRLASWAADESQPAHRIRVRVNSSDTLAAKDVTRFSQEIIEASFNSELLTNGLNAIRVYSLPTASSINYMIVDWIDVEYPRSLSAVGDTLFFSFTNLPNDGLRVVRVSGLTTPAAALYKLSPSPKRISVLEHSSGPPYTITFRDSVSNGDKYLLCSPAKIKIPLTQSSIHFPNLRDSQRSAEYLLITHKRYIAECKSYASTIESQYKRKIALVDVDDIYNEFGFGYPTPESIREYIKSTTRWLGPIPEYLLLVGDATYDYKNAIPPVNPSVAPIPTVPSYGHPVSDPWFAVLDDSLPIPQLCVGRLPVNSIIELKRVIEKIKRYDTEDFDDWNKSFLLFSGGDPNTPGQVESFKMVQEEIIKEMITPPPIGGTAMHFYKTDNPQTNFGPYTSSQIREALNRGGVVINYIGHSGTQTWDNGIGDPAQLQNSRGRSALISDFGCSTAKFAEPDIRSFGELFTLGESGSAIAYIGNSALGSSLSALTLPKYFYRELLRNGVREIGKAHLLAKIKRSNESGGVSSLHNRVMMLTNTLLGDPIVQLALPQKPNIILRGDAINAIPATPTDEDEKVLLSVPLFNTGLVTADSLSVKWLHQYQGIKIETTITCKLPRYSDTISLAYPVKGKPGLHCFTIMGDSENRLDEISESDNTASLQLNVLSRTLKVVSPLPNYSQFVKKFIVLNPALKPPDGSDIIALDIDSSEGFGNPLRLESKMGNVVTSFDLPALPAERYYFWRVGLPGMEASVSQGKFFLTKQEGVQWRQNDSLSFVQSEFLHTELTGRNEMQIAGRVIRVRVTSSGFGDGSFGALELDGSNILPNTFSRGITLAVLDSVTFTPEFIRMYDTNYLSSHSDSLQMALAIINSGKLVVMLVVDDGALQLTSGARAAIRSFGSHFIDSLKLRDSWAFIGWKGARAGSAFEQWRKAYTGRAVIDTLFSRKENSGSLISPDIGPAGKWLNLIIDKYLEDGSQIAVSVIGRKKNGEVEPLISRSPETSISLASIPASIYPTINIKADLFANASGISPLLKQWSVSLEPPAELAVNYQVVSVSQDTVIEGEDVILNGSVYNVGGQKVDSVSVVATAHLQGKWIIPLDTIVVPSIPPNSASAFKSIFNTAGRKGSHTLMISIDPENRLSELYRSNNLYALSIIVSSDTVRPSIEITFDGQHILEGDYVSARPEIRIDFIDNVPMRIVDPNMIELRLDDRKIHSAPTSENVVQQGNGGSQATLIVRPQLTSGEHLLSVQVVDVAGNFADTNAARISFRVDETNQVVDIFNYPNPFHLATDFTFNIVGSKIPEEIAVKIFTIAGRLIQEIKVQQMELRFGLNRMRWDGRDRDGNEIANGVYLYKITGRFGEERFDWIEKLVKMR
ncbi:MAG: C25 family cysteine peptidase [bacterium]